MCLRWRRLPKPLVAAVQGFCIYHGTAVASCADVVLAAEDLHHRAQLGGLGLAVRELAVQVAHELVLRGGRLRPVQVRTTEKELATSKAEVTEALGA